MSASENVVQPDGSKCANPAKQAGHPGHRGIPHAQLCMVLLLAQARALQFCKEKGACLLFSRMVQRSLPQAVALGSGWGLGVGEQLGLQLV